jgi:hypothetical protein
VESFSEFSCHIRALSCPLFPRTFPSISAEPWFWFLLPQEALGQIFKTTPKFHLEIQIEFA